mmetsp:Transcript_25226/g.40487  ORF Transcript_25226/g.40487 Transcript_25226/m.40487 type:complete len:90 (-) Transcript_25226:133-402(-)
MRCWKGYSCGLIEVRTSSAAAVVNEEEERVNMHAHRLLLRETMTRLHVHTYGHFDHGHYAAGCIDCINCIPEELFKRREIRWNVISLWN